MRFLHTSDWHLGRSLFVAPLLEDQAFVLDQLVTIVREEGIECVLLAGDVYDRSIPPVDAVRLLDDVLLRIVVGERVPVIAIAGNHDSADRLGFGAGLLSGGGLHVVSGCARVVTLGDAHGPVDVVAIPYAEPAVVRTRLGNEGVVDHDSALLADLSHDGARPAKGRRTIAMAHAFVAGATASESERPLSVGGTGSVRTTCFDGFGYTALGHLHRPQQVGRPELRYSGSLLKYSFAEADHAKSLTIVDMDARGTCSIEQVSLRPRRDVRVIEGEMNELLRASASDAGRDDYILAMLTDRGAILDAAGKLRQAYPNCLHVGRKSFAADPVEAQRRDPRRHTEAELFRAFFEEVTGEQPTLTEAGVFEATVTQVRRREQEAA
ncbi:MAG TPA: exonuclease SbcCD subunit D [Candidatus Limnocylindrales bacterium]|nr:exonuclease SbcCD subunit D [Candidatus Limnocylindrales bacterium]